MRDQYMRQADGFLLVFSTTSQDDLREIITFRDQILRVKDTDYVPMILVGSKCDLALERQISTKEGSALAKR